jgi:hypothetical protein
MRIENFAMAADLAAAFFIAGKAQTKSSPMHRRALSCLPTAFSFGSRHLQFVPHRSHVRRHADHVFGETTFIFVGDLAAQYDRLVFDDDLDRGRVLDARRPIDDAAQFG